MDLGGGTGSGSGSGSNANGSARRLDAIKLAKVNKWEELRRLVDAEPLTAQQTDSYGMLPLHWACTEPHAIGEGVLMALLKAFPAGARVANTAEMLPLQIAIKAQAKIEWLQALLASYPDAVLHKTPTGEHAVELAKKANLPPRSVRLLEEMYLHVCQKAGYSSDHLFEDEDHSGAGAAASAGAPDDGSYADHASISSLRAVDSAEAAMAMAMAPNGSSRGGAPLTMAAGGPARASRRPSNPDAFKGRTYSSDNDFMGGQDTMAPSYVRGVSTSSNGSGSGGSGGGSMSMHPGVALSKPLPYQVSTRLSSRTVVSLPPRWKNAPNCYICSQKWSTPFRKRHHCRNCGESICGDHSARERMKLPHYGLPDKYRVCTVCHQSLRNAPNELLQPSQGRLTQGVGARRSDEMMPQRGSAGSMNMGGRAANGSMNGGGSNFQLERHVSAPARPMMMDTEYHGIHDQVASLQLKVSQLMEEKEKAESQLRAQAEMLGEPYQSSDPRFTGASSGNAGGMGRRTRLNSVPVTLPSNGYGSAATGGHMPPAAPSSYGGQSAFYSYDGGSQMRSTNSSDREVDIDYGAISMSSAVPEPPTSTESGPIDAMAQLQEDLGSMSFVSSYSEFDDRSTEVYDDIQSPMAFSSGVLEEGDEDEDDDGDVGDSTLPEVEVLVNLGLSMLNKGSCSAAVQAFTRAVEICPDQAVLYSYLAKAHYADDNLDEAVVALEHSLELEPSAANSTLLGKILFEKGDHEKAIEAYQKSLAYQK